MPTLYDNFSQVKQYIDQEKPDLTSYVTKTELANCSYVTSSDLNNYLPLSGGTLRGNLIPSQSASYNLGSSSSRWKEVRSKFTYTDTAYLQDTSYTKSIVPNENNTYSLGSSSYKYNKVWATNLYGQLSGNISNASQLAIDLGGSTIYRLYADKIIPNTTNSVNLGDESHLYSATYSSRLKIGNNSQIYNDGGGISFSVNNNAGIRMGSSNFYPKNNNGMNLGQSNNKWNNAYISNLYTDNIHNFIWTGTSAEYAALSDYTTYQIYMIKES